jgi:hypothetical protein
MVLPTSGAGVGTRFAMMTTFSISAPPAAAGSHAITVSTIAVTGAIPE